MPSLPRRSILLPLSLTGLWSLWEVVSAVAWALKAKGKLAYVIRYTATDGLIGLAVCGLLFAVYGVIRRRLGFRPLIFAALPLCFVFAILWHTLSTLAMWQLGWQEKLWLNASNLLVGGGLIDGITLALFSLLFFAVDYWLQLGEQKQKARAATALAHQAQLQMLRYQLNPHFLFNALNSIRAMILREPERARQIVTELSEFLRYSLNGRGHESTVGEEMQAIENYLAIQRIRFEEKLVVTVRVDPAAQQFVLPCFLIHPLVENAVKYGMETSEPPLRLEIEVAARGRELLIHVANTGRLAPPAPVAPGSLPNGTGTGLMNIARRLELAFPGRHRFSLVEQDGWVRAEIVLQPAGPEEAP
jgi:two-component system LytT family sensor kinase